MPPDALQVIPDPTLDVSQYLFHHPGVDFIWTTGGPKASPAANAAGKPCLERRRRQRPGLRPPQRRRRDGRGRHADLQDVRRVGDLPRRADLRRRRRRSGTRSLAELQRHGRAAALRRRGRRARAVAFDDGRPMHRRRSASRASTSARSPGFEAEADDKVLLAPLPTDLDGAGRAPARAREADAGARARALAVGRARDRGCALVTEHGGPRPHLGRLRDGRGRRRARSRTRVRTGRILVNAPTAVGALGGVYNAMTPTFSLGCGTWGGSTTTDNINYRNLLNVKAVSRRQTPPQWFRVPSDTYFNPGALETACAAARRAGADRHRRRHRGARRGRRGAPPPRRAGAGVRRTSSPSPARRRPRRGRACWRRCGPT